MPGPWRRSIGRWRADNSGRACSTVWAGFPVSPRACAGADGATGTTTRKPSRPRRLYRHAPARPQAAERTVRQQNIAAVRAGDIARDGEAEAGAALILVAGIVEPQERLEHLLAQMRRDAGTIVVDGDGEPAVIA